MESRGESGGVILIIAIVLILLILGGGAGALYFFSRHQTALAVQTHRALLAEAQARMDLEQAHAAATKAEAAHAIFPDGGPASQESFGRSAVESILSAQQKAWNQGDLEAFMAHYWKSDDLTFSSEGQTTRGWTATLTRYQERYPTPEKMGRLQLSELEITPLENSAAMVLGKWNVQREGGPLSGNFTLVVRKVDNRWLIVHDHTSRLKN